MVKISTIFLFVAVFWFYGCSAQDSDPADKTPASEEEKGYMSINATGAYTSPVYIDLESGKAVGVNDNWHFAYQRYLGFRTNSGSSGSGLVTGCVAKKYDELYDGNGDPVVANFAARNAANTLADFESVDSGSCTPTTVDSIRTRIVTADWWNGSTLQTGNQNGWIIQSATISGGYYTLARIKVSEVIASPSKIKLTSEKWNRGSSLYEAAVESDYLDFSADGSRIYWDLETNTVYPDATAAGDAWELSIQNTDTGWKLQVNGSISGPGNAGVGLITIEAPNNHAFAVTDPTNPAQVYTFFYDAVAGTLDSPGDFGPLQYNLYGSHDLSPNFATYLVKKASNFYKFQLLSNYGKNNNKGSGNLYIRYEKLP